MFKNILIVVAVLIAVFLVVVSTRPDHFRVERSAVIAAAPAVVFDHVNDLHKWNLWSPWAKLDPNARIVYSGPAAGNGASFSWDGNQNIGAGSMTVLDSRPDELVRFNLEFIKPFRGVSIAEFTFQPQGRDTLVTWTMYGKNGFMGKVISLFMNCDKMMGGQFEEGFANLKAVVEK